MRQRAACCTATMLLLTSHLAACTEWHVEPMAPGEVLGATHLSRLRITRDDGTRVVFGQPSIIGDTLVGLVQGRRSAMAVTDIATVAIRKTNTANTVLLVGGLVFLTAASARGGQPTRRLNLLAAASLGA
jgi:hypothetical protein